MKTIWDADERHIPHVRGAIVGAVGSSIGGGYGSTSRHLGTPMDNVIGVRYMLYNGTVVEATKGDDLLDNFRQFVDTMPDQFKGFLDEATKAFHDMAERGRHSVADFQGQVAAARDAAKDARKDSPEAFDLNDDAAADAEAAGAVAPEDAQDVVTDAYPGESKDEFRG